jgi:dienelactone hydrolase
MTIKKQTLFITDIYGRTPPLLELAKNITDSFDVVDPYDGRELSFKTEREAYEFFNKEVGLETYTNKVRDHLSGLNLPTRVVAFSAGASAMWRVSEEFTKETITQAECFYGSRIREDTNINPNIPIHLIFPSKEPSFSVSKLIQEIEQKAHVTVTKTKHLHGFMNKLSVHFNETAYNQFIQHIVASDSENSR